MLGRELLMAFPQRDGLCSLQETSGPFGVFLGIHALPSSGEVAAAPLWQRLFSRNVGVANPQQKGRVKGMSEIASARLAALYRYPVKGLSPEAIPEAHLTEGAHFPGDRLMAIENGPSGFNPGAPEHMPKQKFLMLMRNEKLARIEARFDDTPPAHPEAGRRCGRERRGG